MEFETVVRGGIVSTADASFTADVGIENGAVTAIAHVLPRGKHEVDASGMLVLPGAIDVHTHFEDPAEASSKVDDYATGTKAAAVGGITTTLNFAVQKRGRTLREAVEGEIARAEGNVHVDFGLHMTITDATAPGIFESIPGLVDEGVASLKVFTAVTRRMLGTEGLLRTLQVARDNGLLVNVHAEDQPLINQLTRELTNAGRTEVASLPLARPEMAEALATYRVGGYARELGTPVYFVHLSCAQALDAVRYHREHGGEIYVETRPTYLFMDKSKYDLPEREGNKYAVLPPLRGAENQRALWDGIRNGEIQTYATDHAPWRVEQKLEPSSRPFTEIPAGVSNVQTSIGMLYAEGVGRGNLSLTRMVQVASANPAKLFGMWPRKGTIAPGSDADLVVIDPSRSVSIADNQMFGHRMQSNSDYDPYNGYQGVGWPVLTMLRGEVIAREGQIVQAGRGRFVKRDRYGNL